MRIETEMSEFQSVGDLERWLVEVARDRWGVDRGLHNELKRAWRARLDAIRRGFQKDYTVTLEVKVFLTRHGPQRPARLARQQAELQEQWREERGEGDG